MLLPNCKRQLVFSFLILCFLKYEFHHLAASPHNYDHDGLRLLQVRAPTSPHINGAHDHQHYKVGEPEPPQGSPDYDAHDSHPLKIGAPERPTTSPRHSTTLQKSKKRTTSRKSKRIISWALGISVTSLVLSLLLITYLFCRRKRGRGNDVELQANAGNDEELQANAGNDVELQGNAGNDEELEANAGNDVELQAIEEQLKKCQRFNLHTILDATQNFSSGHMLGKGGYGTVYKGTLADGREIAVKRLKSTSGSGQGTLESFINEVNSITRLQHKNIVQLLGYCIEGVEKLLIYEFIPYKSLDVHLFGDSIDNRVGLLLSGARMNIIIGIAEGLGYLHEHPHYKIIHRDIKPSNILLGHGLNPKISDFGLARLFKDEIEANTDRLAGTRGYIAPECMSGRISPTSDVYSFGVVLLEIISGKENSKFNYSLLIYIWDLWRVGRPLELVDEAVAESCDSNQNLLRFINIGLLCVQERAEDRPSMSDVLLMLKSTENILLQVPKKPPFYGDQPNLEASQQSTILDEVGCVNQVTHSTELTPR